MSHLRRMFAVVALALVLGPLLASAPLFDPDEGLHAAIAQEMVQRGDYVTPTFRGEHDRTSPLSTSQPPRLSPHVTTWIDGSHPATARRCRLQLAPTGSHMSSVIGRAMNRPPSVGTLPQFRQLIVYICRAIAAARPANNMPDTRRHFGYFRLADLRSLTVASTTLQGGEGEQFGDG